VVVVGVRSRQSRRISRREVLEYRTQANGERDFVREGKLARDVSKRTNEGLRSLDVLAKVPACGGSGENKFFSVFRRW